MNAQEPEWDALSRMIAGESDSAQAADVSAWLAAHPADAAFAQSVKAHASRAESSADAVVRVDVESALRQVRSRMAEQATTAPALTVARGGAKPDRASSQTRKSSRTWIFAAAAAVIAVVAGQQWQSRKAGTGVERVIATGVGVRDSVVLSDGSKVVLAPGSTLTVAAGFDRGERLVTLVGAAYFEVQHDEQHPFTVHSSGAEIRDIGTSFSVKTDATGKVAVSVTHGIVAIRQMTSATTTGVELKAGDRGIVGSDVVSVTRGTVTAEEVSWTRGQLSYRDASLAEVEADVKRWYGITLQVTDSALTKLTVTMQSQTNTDAARFISTLAAMLGADAEQRGDTVILKSAGRSTTP